MRKRFSLIELAVVLAVLAVLAAIALPMFREAQLRARAVELRACLEGVWTAEAAYHAALDAYSYDSATAYYPDAAPGKSLRAWSNAPAFDAIGWRPDGDVRGSYALAGPQLAPFEYMLSGIMNLDGDAWGVEWSADAVRRPQPYDGQQGCFPFNPAVTCF